MTAAAIAPLVIGLVNNMQDAGLRTAERQFGELLSAAARAEGASLELRFYALPDVPRSAASQAHIRDRYRDVAALWSEPVDGLIVTGAEPCSMALEDEPYWPSLEKLVDWAAGHTNSTLWSCLAAHAAVLRTDGIERRAFGDKLSGVLNCVKTMDHPLTQGLPARWRVPHSRSNDVPKDALLAKGYSILAETEEGGADLFVKERNSLFLFVQGHPEYDPGALAREYRRDVGRFLAGERDDYPEMPSFYFDAASASSFAAFRRRAEGHRDARLIDDFPAGKTDESAPPSWHPPALCLYRNWLGYLARRRSGTVAARRALAGL